VKLYKYCVAERIDVLRNGMIRFTPPSGFNDPFELAPSMGELVPRGWELACVEHLLFRDEEEARAILAGERPCYALFSAVLQHIAPERLSGLTVEAKMETVRAELPNIAVAVLAQAQAWLPMVMQIQLSEKQGVLCLSEVPDNLLMWAHYADSHRGFVLEMDGAHPYFDQREDEDDLLRRAAPVVYVATRPQIQPYNPSHREHSQRNTKAIFFTKGSEWEYEKEWRMVMPLERAADPVLGLFQFPPDLVTGVIVGCRMPKEAHEALNALLADDDRYRHVALRGAFLDQDHYQLNII
jgi:hypothetical protein